ncbi:MAG: thrombospondin type 3 repeat-containing protein, partial [Kiritimatiellaeota bacterium]|nr:thrombospondin type 3 repeat-containing protein [Kiritimatiellota bacterium]
AVGMQAAWLPGYPLPGGALDMFGSTNLSGSGWVHLGTQALTPQELAAGGAALAADLSGRGPGWAGRGFFSAANLVDSNRDGITDAYARLVLGVDPHVFSTAGDGMSDAWKRAHGIPVDLWLDPEGDEDQDGLTNWEEYLNGSDPFSPDTDGDGAWDFWEVAQGSDPNDPSDLGLPPDDVKDVWFNIYSGHVSWEMTLKGASGSDARTLKIAAPMVYSYGIENIHAKLRLGNSYRVSMRWLASGSAFPAVTYYCWCAGFLNQPGYMTYPNYSEERLPVAETVSGVFDWQTPPFGWYIENADGLFTSHTHKEVVDNGGGGRGPGDPYVPLAQRLDATLHMLKFTFVTPAGNPATEPSDSGAGQNQFTYSAYDNPSILTIKLQVKVDPPDLAFKIVQDCKFEVDGVGSSYMTWGPANPGGMPIPEGVGRLTATAEFTGLPKFNSDFGWKTAKLKYKGMVMATAPYGVFFPKDTMNRTPYGGIPEEASTPNWFYYWKDGNVCGIPNNCEYIKDQTFENIFGATTPEYSSDIYLGKKAATERGAPITFHAHTDVPLFPAINYPPVTTGSNSKGILFLAEVIRHEWYHLDIYSQYRSSLGMQTLYPDKDGDGIPDTLEMAGFMDVFSATNHPDTYKLDIRLPGYGYDKIGDEEIRCRLNAVNLTVQIYPERDWANPGCQHKNQYGPKVGQ